MRISRRPRETALGLLSLTTLTNAVALSDFVPQTENLPAQCNAVYVMAIPGCTVSDFANSVCSKACLAGLVQINALVANACATADVEETSIIGLFKMGKAIQLLCNVAVVTTTTGLGSNPSMTIVPMPVSPTAIGSSTMVLSSTNLVTTGLVTDSSMAAKSSTTVPSISQSSTISTSQSSITSTSSSKPPSTTSKPTKTETTPANKTSLSPAQAESQKSGNTNSGGGSPFDNINNSGAASLHHVAQFACGILASILLGSYLALT